MTDPAFLAFFAGEWEQRLRAAQVPGMETASWDRRAAWLLWQAEGRAVAAPAPPALWAPPGPAAPWSPALAETSASLAEFLNLKH